MVEWTPLSCNWWMTWRPSTVTVGVQFHGGLTYKYLSHALIERAKKIKEHHKKNNKHKCERYNLEGIPIAFQVC